MAGDIGTAKKSVLNIFENMEYGKKKNDITLARVSTVACDQEKAC